MRWMNEGDEEWSYRPSLMERFWKWDYAGVATFLILADIFAVIVWVQL